jgi:3-phosphoshikimate 1-carboxyvinyltransferase
MTQIKNAQELKFKETDRLKAMVSNLRLLGAAIEEKDDGLIIHGGRRLHGNLVDSFNDHRVAMAMAVAGLNLDEGVAVNGSECVSISFPGFFDVLESAVHRSH